MFSFFKDKEFWKVLIFFTPFYYFSFVFTIPFMEVYGRYAIDKLLSVPPGWEYLNGVHIFLFLIFFISYKARKIYLSNIKPSAFQTFKKMFVPTLIITLIILAFYVVFSYVGCPSHGGKFCAASGWLLPGGIDSTVDFARTLLPLIIVYPLLATLVIETKKTGKVYRILFWLIAAILYAWIPFAYFNMSGLYN